MVKDLNVILVEFSPSSRVILTMKKNQDPKEAMKSLISDAREHAASIEAACKILENALNGVDPEHKEFLDKMAELYDGRLVVNKLRTVLQTNFVRTSTSSR